jgi:hypothetical protein
MPRSLDGLSDLTLLRGAEARNALREYLSLGSHETLEEFYILVIYIINRVLVEIRRLALEGTGFQAHTRITPISREAIFKTF